jgi:hypothetical protein
MPLKSEILSICQWGVGIVALRREILSKGSWDCTNEERDTVKVELELYCSGERYYQRGVGTVPLRSETLSNGSWDCTTEERYCQRGVGIVPFRSKVLSKGSCDCTIQERDTVKREMQLSH